MTLQSIYTKIKDSLNSSGIEDSGFEAKLILKRYLNISDSEFLTLYNREIEKEKELLIEKAVQKRKERYPLQYILGEWDFYKYTFKVGEGVLIPRSDTEILVEKAVEYLKNTKNPQVLDLCAGSGCIGISIAKDYPHSTVTLVEKFDSAFTYLLENIELNNAKNAKALNGDVLKGDASDGIYDLIVSNPPYIPPNEMDIISPETNFEPETALLGGEDGMLFYKAIIENYKKSLKKGGMLGFEVGINKDEAVANLLKEALFENITVTKDFNGINRVVTAIK
jgi:release factor glutamine methyltransferase